MSDIRNETHDTSSIGNVVEKNPILEVKPPFNEWYSARRSEGNISLINGVNVISNSGVLTTAEEIVNKLPSSGSPDSDGSPCIIFSLANEGKELTREHGEVMLRDVLKQQARLYPNYEIAIYFQPESNRAYVYVGKRMEVARQRIPMPFSVFVGHTHPTNFRGLLNSERVSELSSYIDTHSEADTQSNLFLLESTEEGGLSLIPSIPDLKSFFQRINIEMKLGKHKDMIASEFGTTQLELSDEVEGMPLQEKLSEISFLEKELEELAQSDTPSRERVKWIIDNIKVTIDIYDPNIKSKINLLRRIKCQDWVILISTNVDYIKRLNLFIL